MNGVNFPDWWTASHRKAFILFIRELGIKISDDCRQDMFFISPHMKKEVDPQLNPLFDYCNGITLRLVSPNEENQELGLLLELSNLTLKLPGLDGLVAWPEPDSLVMDTRIAPGGLIVDCTYAYEYRLGWYYHEGDKYIPLNVYNFATLQHGIPLGVDYYAKFAPSSFGIDLRRAYQAFIKMIEVQISRTNHMLDEQKNDVAISLQNKFFDMCKKGIIPDAPGFGYKTPPGLLPAGRWAVQHIPGLAQTLRDYVIFAFNRKQIKFFQSLKALKIDPHPEQIAEWGTSEKILVSLLVLNELEISEGEGTNLI